MFDFRAGPIGLQPESPEPALVSASMPPGGVGGGASRRWRLGALWFNSVLGERLPAAPMMYHNKEQLLCCGGGL